MMQEYMKSCYVKIYHNFELLGHCGLVVPENKTSSMQLAYFEFPKLLPVFLDLALQILFVQQMGWFLAL